MSGYRRFAKSLYKVNRAIGKAELALISVIMAILVVVMTYQVVTRYFLSIPATWAEELCRYLFIWASFVGGAYALFISDHIEIDLIDTVIQKRSRHPAQFLAYFKKVILLIVLVFLCYFFRVYLGYVLQIAKLGQYSGAMEINMVYPMASGVVGFGLMIFHDISLLIMPIKKTDAEPMSDEEAERL